MDKPNESIVIEMSEPVSLTFSLKYLVNFCKASSLSANVKLCLSNEVPLLVEYDLGSNSNLRFYLAPKVCTLTHPNACVCLRSRLTRPSRLATRTKGVGNEEERGRRWARLQGERQTVLEYRLHYYCLVPMG